MTFHLEVDDHRQLVLNRFQRNVIRRLYRHQRTVVGRDVHDSKRRAFYDYAIDGANPPGGEDIR